MNVSKISDASRSRGGEHHKGTEQDQDALAKFFAERDLAREARLNHFFRPTTPEQHWRNICQLVKAGAYAKVREYVERYGGTP